MRNDKTYLIKKIDCIPYSGNYLETIVQLILTFAKDNQDTSSVLDSCLKDIAKIEEENLKYPYFNEQLSRKIIAMRMTSFLLEKKSDHKEGDIWENTKKKLISINNHGNLHGEIYFSSGIQKNIFPTSTVQALRALCDLVEKAQHSFYLEVFLFNPNCKTAKMLMDAISNLEQQRKGQNHQTPIDIKFVVNQLAGIGKKFAPHWLNEGAVDYHKGEKNNKKINILQQFIKELDPNYIRMEVYITPHRYLGCNHKKLYVVDNQYVIMSSMNVVIDDDLEEKDDKFLFPPEPIIAQREMSVLFEGRVAQDSANSILKNLANKGKLLFTNGDMSIEMKQTAFNEINQISHPSITLNNELILCTSKSIDQCNIVMKNTPIHSAIKTLMRNAQSSIKLCTPNLQILDFMDEILFALARGVRVEIYLIEMNEQPLSSLMGMANNESKNYLETIFKKYIKNKNRHLLNIKWDRMQKYDGSWHVPYYLAPYGAIHMKLYIFDEKVAAFGSYNLDYSSVMCDENVVLSRDVAQYLKFFNKLFDNGIETTDHQVKNFYFRKMVGNLFFNRRSHDWVNYQPTETFTAKDFIDSNYFILPETNHANDFFNITHITVYRFLISINRGIYGAFYKQNQQISQYAITPKLTKNCLDYVLLFSLIFLKNYRKIGNWSNIHKSFADTFKTLRVHFMLHSIHSMFAEFSNVAQKNDWNNTGKRLKYFGYYLERFLYCYYSYHLIKTSNDNAAISMVVNLIKIVIENIACKFVEKISINYSKNLMVWSSKKICPDSLIDYKTPCAGIRT